MFTKLIVFISIATVYGSYHSLDDLAAQLDGNILTPSSAEYEITRQQFDLSFTRSPSAIIQCSSTDDVKLSLQYVLDNDLEFTVRSGRHSLVGWSTCDDCICIDLRLLNNIKINEQHEEPTVSVNSGVLLNELFYALEYHSKSRKKYWLPAGIENVGVGGHVHGGGWGIGSRKHGMAMDNLVEAKVVTVSVRNCPS